MKRILLALLALLLPALPALSAAAKPLRVGLLTVSEPKPATPGVRRWENTQSPLARARRALPAKLGAREVKYELLPIGQDNPELEVYDLLVLTPETTPIFAQLDRHAEAFHRYVNRGGGLVVFQPNPMYLTSE